MAFKVHVSKCEMARTIILSVKDKGGTWSVLYEGFDMQ
jgi:hypothetical protein